MAVCRPRRIWKNQMNIFIQALKDDEKRPYRNGSQDFPYATIEEAMVNVPTDPAPVIAALTRERDELREALREAMRLLGPETIGVIIDPDPFLARARRLLKETDHD